MTPPPWALLPGLPWTANELKSALQKYVRRRDPRAYAVARALLSHADGASGLFRRLPTIALEEGVPAALPAAMELLSLWSRKATRDQVTEAATLDLIAQLLETAERDKDPTYLTLAMMERVYGPYPYALPTSPAAVNWPAFERAVARGQAEQADLLLVRSWSTAGALEAIERCAVLTEDAAAAALIRQVLRRARFGLMDEDCWLYAGWAIAVAARVARSEPAVHASALEPAVPEPAVRVSIPEPLPELTLAWWTQDVHTSIGKTVLRDLLTPLIAPARGEITWFVLESDLTSGAVDREGWRRRFQESITADERAWWAASRDEAQTLVELAIQAKVARWNARRATDEPVAPPKPRKDRPVPPLAVEQVGEHGWRVASESEPDKTYYVGRDGDEWNCQCIAAMKFPNRRCKHVRRVLQTLASEART